MKREISFVVGAVPHDFELELGLWGCGRTPSEPILLLVDCGPRIALAGFASQRGFDADQTHTYLMELCLEPVPVLFASSLNL